MATRFCSRLKNIFKLDGKADSKTPHNGGGAVGSYTDFTGPGHVARNSEAQTKVGGLLPVRPASPAVERASSVPSPTPSVAVPLSPVSANHTAPFEPCTSPMPAPTEQVEIKTLISRGKRQDGFDVENGHPTTFSPNSSDRETLQRELQKRLWNKAYNELKVSETKIIEVYEKILSAELNRNDSISALRTKDNEIEQIQDKRSCQMKQLVQAGLERTEKQAAIKQGIENVLQAISTIRGIIDSAVQASPEAAIAWVGVCLGLEILSNPVTEASINRQGIAYVISRMEWYWNLVCLLLDVNMIDKSSAGLRDELEKHVTQLYKKLLLYQIKSVCLYNRNAAAVLLRDMVKLDDWDCQLKEIKDAENLVQRDSEQYNTEQVKSYLGDLTIVAGSQEKRLQEIYSAIQDQTELQERRNQDDKDEQCLKDLHITDPRDDKKRIEHTKGGLFKDAYLWVLNHADFQQFRDDPQSRLLWIRGDPGKGKTMLLCGIIDELGKESANRLSYFFCQAAEPQLSNATAVLRGLIYLLIIQQPLLISHVREKYNVTGAKLFESINAWVSLTSILTDMLKDPTLENVVLVVDALDECETNRSELLDFITKSSSTHAKWIVSSRNWLDIEKKLDNTTQKVTLPLESNEDSIFQAVHSYIHHKVNQLASEKHYNKDLQVAVREYLISNANGTFLWVALVCEELAKPKVRKRHTLAKLKSFPPGLDSLYERMMEHISDSLDADFCKQILATASVVYRPVTLKELTSLIESLEEFGDDLDEIIGSCGSFLTLKEGVVSFVHQSAKDFLLKQAFDQILPAGIAHQHHVIFSRSLDILSKTLKRDIYRLKVPGFPIDQISRPYPDPLASARYSCIYWVDHLCDSNLVQIKRHDEALRDGSAIHNFLREKYLFWLEALSLLCSMSEGVMAMQKLDTLVRTTKKGELEKIIRDACRFILSYAGVIEIAPLQVYASGLVFSPACSIVRQLFKNEAPEWIISKPLMESNWDACLQTLEGHDNMVSSVVFSADNRRLASGSGDKTIKIWDAATGACLQTLKGHDEWVNAVAFSQDNRQLASSSSKKSIKIWDAATGACLQTLEGHNSSVSAVAFSQDNRRLAYGLGDKKIKICDTATGACLQTLEGHNSSVNAVAFSLDGQHLASGSSDKAIKIWDTATGNCLHTVEGHEESVNSVVFSADGRQLASGSYDTTIKIWDVDTGAPLQTLQGHNSSVNTVAFSLDGRYLASGSSDKAIKIWDTTTGNCLQTLEGHSNTVNSVVFTADNQRLASGSYDTTVRIWDTATDPCLQTLERHSNSVNLVVLSQDGQKLASGSSDTTIKLWDAATGNCLQTFIGHGNAVNTAVFSADGKQLASGSYDTTVRIWNVATGVCIHRLEGHYGTVNSVSFSQDGRLLASGSRDKTIRIWITATGVILYTFKRHKSSVVSVLFSPDGRWLASSSLDGTIMIWDAFTGNHLQTHNIDRPISHLSFDPITNARRSTDLRGQKLDLNSVIDTLRTRASEDVRRSGFGISGVWIEKDNTRLLWLPPDYRPYSSAVTGSTLAIGCKSGRVLVLQFSEKRPTFVG